MTYSQILDVINQNIKQNGNEEITGVVLNSVLRALLGFVNDGFITINDVIQILADTKSVNIIGSIGLTTDTTSLPAGVYNTQTSGTYTNASNIVVKEGYYTLLRKLENGNWVLESEVKIPMQDLTDLENRTTALENRIEPNGNVTVGQTTRAVNGDKVERYVQRNAFVDFKHSFADKDGYEINSKVFVDNKFWISKVDGNKDYPSKSSTKWKEFKITEDLENSVNTLDGKIQVVEDDINTLESELNITKDKVTALENKNGGYVEFGNIKNVEGRKVFDYVNNKSITKFNPTAYEGGYPKDALVIHGNAIYASKIASNTEIPSKTALNWTEIKFSADVDQEFDENSENAISNKKVTPLATALDGFTQGEITILSMTGADLGLRDDLKNYYSNNTYRSKIFDLPIGNKYLIFKGWKPNVLPADVNDYSCVFVELDNGDIQKIIPAVSNADSGEFVEVNNLKLPNNSVKMYVTVMYYRASYGYNTFIEINNGELSNVKDYIDNNFEQKHNTIENVTIKRLNDYTSFDDSRLLNGIISETGIFSPKTNGDKVIAVDIPDNSKYIKFFNIDTLVYFQTANENGMLSHGITSDYYHEIPDGAVKLYFTARASGVFKIDFTKDYVTFSDNKIDSEIPKNIPMIQLGTKQYTFNGDDFRIFADSTFSGFEVLNNYNIEFTGDSVIGERNNKGKFVKIQNAGTLSVNVFDLNRKLITSKTTQIFKKPKPTIISKNPTPDNKLQILFIGDSLFHFNKNEIGREFLRMLNTDNPSKQIIDNNILLPTYNLGKGNVELVGSLGDSTNKYTIANKLSIIMTGTNTNVSSTNGNPFFNSASTQPNELDADGWNKKIDFSWYFQKICGAGKYPKYIYLACGVNDIVDYKWDNRYLIMVRNRMREVLVKIKKACDSIAGGTSDVKVLLVNHQYYPLNEGHTFDSSFSAARQRRVWAEHYTAYEEMISNDTYNGYKLSDFVRFIDCASSFDAKNCYDYIEDLVNPRTNKITHTVYDIVHMSKNGAYLYADALLRDFLYNECE